MPLSHHAYDPVRFWHLHDQLQPGFRTPIVKIIVKTWLKNHPECSACRHPCGHALRMAAENAGLTHLSFMPSKLPPRKRGTSQPCVQRASPGEGASRFKGSQADRP